MSRRTQLTRPSSWHQFTVLFGRDIKQELHTRDMLSAMAVYALLVLVIFGAALAQSSSSFDILEISGGLFWALIVFTSLLGLNRSFNAEKEEGGIEGMLLIPMDRSLIFLAKAASNLVFLLIVELIAAPLFYFFFLTASTPASSLWLVCFPLLAGSIGIAGVGTLLATITSQARGRDVLLAILFIPLVFPLLYAVVSATSIALTGGPEFATVYLPSLALAFGYDVIMVSVSWLLYDYLITS